MGGPGAPGQTGPGGQVVRMTRCIVLYNDTCGKDNVMSSFMY